MIITPELIHKQLTYLKATAANVVWVRADVINACLGERFKDLVLLSTKLSEQPSASTDARTLRKMKDSGRIAGYTLVQVERMLLVEAMEKAIIDKEIKDNE